MLKRFEDHLRALDIADKKILVAASGGLDSTVLVDLLLRLGYPIGLAHANFQLRGSESDEDEAWVRNLGSGLDLPCHSRRFNTNNYATEKGVSIQMAARELRYAWFDEILALEKYDFLATAHHASDSLETGLLNFTRGTGLRGMQGIPMKSGKIIRPLLIFTRQEIEAYAAGRQLKWREDSSNATDDYSRNFIRHQVVPKLKELNPALEATFARSADRFKAAQELTNRALAELRADFVLDFGAQIKILKSFFGSFRNPAPVLFELILDFGFNIDQCFEMVDAAGGQPGKKFLSPTHQLVVDREYLIVSIHPGDWTEVLIEREERRARMGPWSLKIEDCPVREIHSDKSTAILDKAKLRFPLRWRKWKSGDSFVPLGMDHKKKLSDFLIDAKVSVADKGAVTVLESGGEIAWLVGWRIDNRFKIDDNTERAVVITLEH